jgi:hypothetical protein
MDWLSSPRPTLASAASNRRTLFVALAILGDTGIVDDGSKRKAAVSSGFVRWS